MGNTAQPQMAEKASPDAPPNCAVVPMHFPEQILKEADHHASNRYCSPHRRAGRVVIPKEIRRTLRIREGDPLEIYTDRDGEVILKKYSPIGEMSSFAKDYTESLFRSLGHIAVIVDRDQVVAASGLPRKELGDKPISRALETAIASRQTVALNQQSGGRMVAVTTEEDQNPNYTAQVISPIIADGEAIGAVLLMSRDNGVKMGDTELKVAETAAGIVGRQMEQ